MEGDQNHDGGAPVPPLHVVEVDPQTDPRWEVLVTTLPNSLIYHHPAWLRVLKEACGGKLIGLACENTHGQLRGVLPLFYKRGVFSGRRYSSLLRTPVAGPLAYDDQAATTLIRAAIERVRGEPGTLLQIKVLSNAFDGLVDGIVCVPERVMYLLELPEQPELLHLDARIKRAVNKASRLGVEVSPAQTERELRDWYELYLDTMRQVAATPRPYHFFKIAWQRLRPLGLLRLLLAKRYEAGRSRILGGLLLLMGGQTVFYAESGWRREDQSLRINDALHWRAIHDACAEGFRCYNFGEVPRNNSSLARYKSKWGAEPKWLYNYYYPAPRENSISAERKLARQLTNAAWRLLPNKITTLLSGWAYRYF